MGRRIAFLATPLLFPGPQFLLKKEKAYLAAVFPHLEFCMEPEREKEHDQRDNAEKNCYPEKDSTHHFSASSAFLLITSISSLKLLVLRIWLNWSL